MIQFENAVLKNCAVHRVGNKNTAGTLLLSPDEIAINEEIAMQLKQYFISPFKNIPEAQKFSHAMDLKMNEVFTSADNIFENKSFIKNTQNIAKHLFQQTRHTAIKDGELFIALIDGLVIDNTSFKAIGIFKSEAKEPFIKVKQTKNNIDITLENGIGQHRLDKGCLIINDDHKDGYIVFTYEKNKADTDYWRNDFLSVLPKDNNYFQTKQFLNICKDYITEQLPNSVDVTKAEQVALLNKSVDYFKNNEDFKLSSFTKEVFEEPGVIKEFKTFRNSYQTDEEYALNDEFNISDQAVKNQAKYFKSVIKLDKNFHLYVHGDQKMIEKGYDEKRGLSFYKIFYKEEK